MQLQYSPTRTYEVTRHFQNLEFHAEMELNVTASNSLSQLNFYADVAPEVDTGTSNPDTGFSSISSVPSEKLWDNTSNYATAASFPTL